MRSMNTFLSNLCYDRQGRIREYGQEIQNWLLLQSMLLEADLADFAAEPYKAVHKWDCMGVKGIVLLDPENSVIALVKGKVEEPL